MARGPRVAAHLGRPETPEEERARKAENSKNYRNSQTFTNLIFALVVTLVIVAAVYLIVPRGELERAPEPDVETIAANASTQLDRTVVVPPSPEGWLTNHAALEAGVWTVNYNDIPGENRAFVRFAQAFDADDTWASQTLAGSVPTGTVSIDGIEWSEFELHGTNDSANISYALGVQAGNDYVLLYGSGTAKTTAELARVLAPSVAALDEEGSS